MKRQIATRIFLTLKTLLLVCISFLEPHSLSYALLQIGGPAAELCLAVLVVLTVIALLDTIVNDVMPAGFSFHTGWKFRQVIWMLIAITYAGQAFVVVRHGLSYWLAMSLFIDAAWCATVAFLDLHFEHAAQSQHRRSTDFGELHA